MGSEKRRLAALALIGAVAGSALPAHAVDPSFRLHADEFPISPLTRLIVGVNVGDVEISSLTIAPSYPDSDALLAGDVWDFSTLDGADRVLQAVPVAPGWTCYVPEPGSIPDAPCGFDRPENDFLFVQDALDTDARDTLAIDFDGVGTYYLRAWAIDEGDTPATGDDELRLCLWPDGDRKEVPFVVFQHPDAMDPTRQYMLPGDTWGSETFECSNFGSPIGVTQGSPCGSAGGLSAVLNDGNETMGRIIGRATSIGTLTLPSGHQLDAILVESLASFRAVLNPFCIDTGERTRQYQLMWLVPGYGPMVQVRSPDDQPPGTPWTTTTSTVVGYGLLPPLSIQVDAVTATTVTVSWDPGTITRFIDGYEVHWGTEPATGGAAPPPFSSGFLDAAAGTSHVVSGLLPETTYWFTVTTLRSYTDPRSGETTPYRSIGLPESIGADVDGDGERDTSYPPEVSATTEPGAGDSLAVSVPVELLGSGPSPLLDSLFDAGCQVPPHRLCPDTVEPGPLPHVAFGHGIAGGGPSLTLYQHSSPTTTMRVMRSADDLIFQPN